MFESFWSAIGYVTGGITKKLPAWCASEETMDLNLAFQKIRLEDGQHFVREYCARPRAVRVRVELACCEDKYTLPCGHVYCTHRLIQIAAEQSNQTFGLREYRCACTHPFTFRLIETITKANFDRIRSEAEKATLGEVDSEPSFVCGICQERLQVGEGLTLDCSHRFCRPCLIEGLEVAITRGEVGQLLCPMHKCSHPLSESIIQAHLGTDLKAKLDLYRLKQLKAGSEGERVVICTRCDFPYIVGTNETNQLSCKLCAQPLPILNAEEPQIEGFKRCPSCKEAVLKEAGCNFMKCPWPGCETYFCDLCPSLLTLKDHYSHYLDGPFGHRCNGKQ
jgi:hypothetical protein